jgi:geranyl-CoA carboxylase alpha subunit
MMKKIHKILIANRGEIAVRVIRSARQLGFRTVAVYSEADAGALHVHEADQSVCIGAASVGESYLVADKIIAAAELTGADAIHPGYGFLSENAAFSQSCSDAGITFIGPDAAAIALMGSKRLSKIAMLEAGVPCIPGYQGEDQTIEYLIEKAAEVGFPLMVKASAGGGGRGMRLVFAADELDENIRTARSEALSAFGSGELILERAVLEPRHIEIQIFADNDGHCVYLGERDCSIQRRHQKVVEEAPSPFVDEALRRRMGMAAVDAAKSCHYRGAGTVEFLVDADKNFYFLEMNTRLQVEHPVTELITGLDLVEWQLRVASGEPLPLSQPEITLTGHAVEVRLYAEDPRNDFMPQTGKVLQWHTPADENPARLGVRVDHGIQQGQTVSPFYDPMLAKLIAFGENREVAIRRLGSAVEDSCLLGVNHNKLFLQRVLRHPVFNQGEATTAFIEQHFANDCSMSETTPSVETLARAALLFYQRGETMQPQYSTANWSSSAGNRYLAKLEFDGKPYSVQLHREQRQGQGRRYVMQVSASTVIIELVSSDNNRCVMIEDGVRNHYAFAFDNDSLYLDDGRGHFRFDDIAHLPAVIAGGAGSGQVKASMDGAIVEVLVASGQLVEQGQTLVILEAMKMEHRLKAAVSGVVDTVLIKPGQQVKSKQLLVNITVTDAD